MTSLFGKIIRGELPARIVWRDAHAVAFLDVRPLQPGHTLVVPVTEVDHWLDAAPELNAHLFDVAQKIGVALQRAFSPVKVGLIIAGLEVPHQHLHLVPIHALRDLNFANAKDPGASALDAAAEKLRAALHEDGHAEVVNHA